MKKRQKETKRRQSPARGELALLGLTALFLCSLFLLRDHAPGAGVTVHLTPSGTGGAAAKSTPEPMRDAAAVRTDPDSAAERQTGADGDSAVEARTDMDGAAEPFPSETEDPPALHTEESSISGADETGNAVTFPINVNTADRDALISVPGIGPVIADRILAYRAANGPFPTVEDLTAVQGIGNAKLSAIRQYVSVGEAVNP